MFYSGFKENRVAVQVNCCNFYGVSYRFLLHFTACGGQEFSYLHVIKTEGKMYLTALTWADCTTWFCKL